ncbi:hypothetical protein VFPBJ_09266 [Purpureocillium lilacinum]|uniref:Uncharacterized protein n=1 Tax=Purpureocillium lilacinum TaxID=33203 RepID=A0A179GD21_PURLI|nr:hypothetical protein VFPBJ_09266 [Purpureocillium lilacinum]
MRHPRCTLTRCEQVPTDRTTQGSFHQCCKRQRARLRGRIDDVQTASAMPFPRGPAGTLPLRARLRWSKVRHQPISLFEHPYSCHPGRCLARHRG